MKSFFNLVLLVAAIFLACHFYFTNREVQKSVDSLIETTRRGLKSTLRMGSDAL